MRIMSLMLCLVLSGAVSFAAEDKKDAKKADKPVAAEAKKVDAKPATPAPKIEEKKPEPKPATAPAPKAEAKKPDAKPAEKKPEPAKPVETKVAAGQVSFAKDVAPILLKQCMACHGQKDPKGQYQLHTFEMLLKPGESGEAVVTAGNPDKSYLFELINSKSKSDRMPKDGDPLAADQVATIKKWIEQGAKYDSADAKALLVSIVPKLPHPAAPEKYRVPIAVTAVALRPDGKELAVSGYHEIQIWDPAEGKLLRRIGNVEERVYSLAYKADGSVLASAGGTPGQSGEVALYDTAKGTLARSLGAMSDVAFGVAFSPKGDKLAACAADRSIRIYDVASGKEERLIEDHADWVMGIAWDAAGERLASASRDKTAKVFNLKTGEAIATYPTHGDSVYTVAFSADGKQVFSGGADKRLHAWNPADGKQIGVAATAGEAYRIALFKDQLAVSCSDKTVKLFAQADRKAIKTLAGQADYVFSVDWNGDGKRIASGGFDGQVIVFDVDKGDAVSKFFAAPGYTPPAPAQAAAKK